MQKPSDNGAHDLYECISATVQRCIKRTAELRDANIATIDELMGKLKTAHDELERLVLSPTTCPLSDQRCDELRTQFTRLLIQVASITMRL